MCLHFDARFSFERLDYGGSVMRRCNRLLSIRFLIDGCRRHMLPGRNTAP